MSTSFTLNLRGNGDYMPPVQTPAVQTPAVQTPTVQALAVQTPAKKWNNRFLAQSFGSQIISISSPIAKTRISSQCPPRWKAGRPDVIFVPGECINELFNEMSKADFKPPMLIVYLSKSRNDQYELQDTVSCFQEGINCRSIFVQLDLSDNINPEDVTRIVTTLNGEFADRQRAESLKK